MVTLNAVLPLHDVRQDLQGWFHKFRQSALTGLLYGNVLLSVFKLSWIKTFQALSPTVLGSHVGVLQV